MMPSKRPVAGRVDSKNYKNAAWLSFKHRLAMYRGARCRAEENTNEKSTTPMSVSA
jgi:hypothetical protein